MKKDYKIYLILIITLFISSYFVYAVNMNDFHANLNIAFDKYLSNPQSSVLSAVDLKLLLDFEASHSSVSNVELPINLQAVYSKINVYSLNRSVTNPSSPSSSVNINAPFGLGNSSLNVNNVSNVVDGSIDAYFDGFVDGDQPTDDLQAEAQSIGRKWYVSKKQNNGDGTSWEKAWNELDKINWPSIQPGDTIYIDGGSYEMNYSTSLNPTVSGTSSKRITITRSNTVGHKGTVNIKLAQVKLLGDYLTLDGLDYNFFKIYVGNTGGYGAIQLGGGGYNGDNIIVRNIWAVGKNWGNTYNGVSLNIYGNNDVVSHCRFTYTAGEDMIGVITGGNAIIENNFMSNNVQAAPPNPLNIHRDFISIYPGTNKGSTLTIRNNIFYDGQTDCIINIANSGVHGGMNIYGNVFAKVNNAIKTWDSLGSIEFNNVYNNIFYDLTDGTVCTDCWRYKHNFTNNILAAGAGIPPQLKVIYSIFTSDAGSYSSGTGNIKLLSSDILFKDATHLLGADNKPFTNDDGLNIVGGSKAINAGIDTTWLRKTDILGNAISSKTDIGAYEYNSDGGTVVKSTYYVNSASGDDLKNGLSEATAWKTVTKVNSMAFNPGEKVLFKRGEVWNAQLEIKESGTANNPIYFGAYGTGAKPLLKGAGNSIDRGVIISGNYIKLENIESSDWKKTGFKITGNDIDLIGCAANRNKETGSSDGFSVGAGAGNILFANCTASYNERRGIQVDEGTIGYIKILDGEFHHQYAGNEADGISIFKNNNVLIDGVSSHHNSGMPKQDQGDGIQISNCINPIVRNSRLYNNHNSGVIFNYPQGGKIYTNLIYNNDRNGIASNGNFKNELNIYSNTVYNNEYQIYFYEKSPSAKVNVKNNIFYGSSANKRAAFLASGLNDNSIFMDYNCYWGDNNEYLVQWSTKMYKKDEFSKYQSIEAQDKSSIFANPLFVNIGTPDLHLNPKSPCIDKGANTGLLKDFDGKTLPQGFGPDIGAYESSSENSGCNINSDCADKTCNIKMCESNNCVYVPNATCSACYDSDGTKNVNDIKTSFVNGTISYNIDGVNYNKVDYCSDSKTSVFEYYCDKNSMKVVELFCAKGCSGGACLPDNGINEYSAPVFYTEPLSGIETKFIHANFKSGPGMIVSTEFLSGADSCSRDSGCGTVAGSFSKSSDIFLTGKSSMKFSGKTLSSGVSSDSNLISVKAGKMYRVEGNIYHKLNSGEAYVSVEKEGFGGLQCKTLVWDKCYGNWINCFDKAKWYKIACEFIPSSDMDVFIRTIVDGNADGEAWFDDLSMKEISSSLITCGNNIIEGEEQCDDGNSKNDDGCSSICKKELPKSKAYSSFYFECNNGVTQTRNSLISEEKFCLDESSIRSHAKIGCSGSNDGVKLVRFSDECTPPGIFYSSCKDGDNGINYYKKSNVTLGYTNGEDSCLLGDSATKEKDYFKKANKGPVLAELVCENDGLMNILWYTCPNGCEDGKCIISSTPRGGNTR